MAKHITIAEFEDLKRGPRVEELRRFDEEHSTQFAKNMSRARLDVLAERYKEALLSIVVEPGSLGIPDTPDDIRMPVVEDAPVNAGGTQTGRLRSDQPNEGGKPQADPGQRVLIRREEGIHFFIKKWDIRERPLTNKEEWLLKQVKGLRDKVGPVYKDPGSGKRSNPSKQVKHDLREKLRTLEKEHDIVCIRDEMVKQLNLEQPAPVGITVAENKRMMDQQRKQA